MRETHLSKVVAWSYNGMETAYRFARYVLNPNPQHVLWGIGAVLLLGTIGSLGYIVLAATTLSVFTNPVQLLAVAVLYGIDLLAMYTVGSMIRQLS